MIVKYSKKFPYAPYLNEDIGFEEGIADGSSEEEMLEALRRLSSVALKFHKENNPQLQLADAETIKWELGDEYGQSGKMKPFQPTSIPSIDRKAIERMEKLIDEAPSLEVLQGYKKDVESLKDNDLNDLYDNKVMWFNGEEEYFDTEAQMYLIRKIPTIN